jgi:hypothetical protein
LIIDLAFFERVMSFEAQATLWLRFELGTKLNTHNELGGPAMSPAIAGCGTAQAYHSPILYHFIIATLSVVPASNAHRN